MTELHPPQARDLQLELLNPGAQINDLLLSRVHRRFALHEFDTLCLQHSVAILQLRVQVTTTAVMCIDHLGAVLAHVAARAMGRCA
ncbi:MAG: hypothetical protein ABI349_07885 [Casimicrobiaceae bacterium]